MNLRLDHKINRDMSLQIVGYYGYDRLKLGLREFDAKSYGSTTESDTPSSTRTQTVWLGEIGA